MTPARDILLITSDRDLARRLPSLLPSDHRVHVHRSFRDADATLGTKLPDVALLESSSLDDFLMHVLFKHQSVVIGVLAGAMDAPAHDLVAGRSDAGHFLTTIDPTLDNESLRKSLIQLVGYRRSHRVNELPPLDARFVLEVGGESSSGHPHERGAKREQTTYKARVQDVGNLGCSLLIEKEPELFLPGIELRELEIRRGADTLARLGNATVIYCRRSIEGYRIGLSYQEPGSPSVLDPVLLGGTQVGTLLRKARVRLVMVRLSEPLLSQGIVSGRITDVNQQAGRFSVAHSGLETLPAPGTALRLNINLGSASYTGFCSVVSGRADEIELTFPPSVKTQVRREFLRVRPQKDRPFRLILTSPFSGRRVEADVVDIHRQGASFVRDLSSDVLPKGVLLRDLELVLPSGDRLKCPAVVRRLVPLTTSADSEARPHLVGLEFLKPPAEARVALAEAFIADRCPSARDASCFEFGRIFRLLQDAGARFPDYPTAAETRPLAEVHAKLPAIDPGLIRALAYVEPTGEPVAYASGIRVYPKTWMLQHLAARSRGKSSVAVARELATSIVEFVEATEGIDFLRCVWREGNRWVHQMTALVARSSRVPGLSDLRRLVYLRLPSTRPRPLSSTGTIRASPVVESQLPVLCDCLRAVASPLRVNAEALTESGLGLTDLHRQFSAYGLRRLRRAFMVEVEGLPVAAALLEEATEGLCWSNIMNAFRLEIFQPHHPHLADALNALVIACVECCRALGLPSCVALVEEAQEPVLLAVGFADRLAVYEWTFHRRLVRVWRDLIWATMEQNVHVRTS